METGFIRAESGRGWPGMIVWTSSSAGPDRDLTPPTPLWWWSKAPRLTAHLCLKCGVLEVDFGHPIE